MPPGVRHVEPRAAQLMNVFPVIRFRNDVGEKGPIGFRDAGGERRERTHLARRVLQCGRAPGENGRTATWRSASQAASTVTSSPLSMASSDTSHVA